MYAKCGYLRKNVVCYDLFRIVSSAESVLEFSVI